MTAQDGYERRIGRYSAPLAERLLALVPVAPGQRVADVGCGRGALTGPLADAVGAANVAGIDSDATDLAICRARVPGADLRIGDAHDLPFQDGSFDVVFAQLLVHLVDDAPQVAAEMHRIARPDAPVVTCVWDFADGMTALRAFWDSVAASGAPGADLHDQKGYAYATPAELEQLFRDAGLRDVETGAVTVHSRYEDFDDLWHPLTVADGTPGRYLASLDDDLVEDIRGRLHAEVGSPVGSFELPARAWYVIGRR